MTAVDSTVAAKVAIYWDFENVHASLFEERIGSYRNERLKPQPELVDVGAVMDYAKTLGNVSINRAYCNWSFFYRYSDALSGHGISLVQMFPRGLHGKNGADIQMCVDMVEDLLRLDVDICIMVSGDSDFIGAAQKVRQYGKRVIGIGVRDYSNRHFQRMCDEFKFYDMLVKSEEATPVTMDDSGKMTLDSAKQLLVAAVSRLAGQYGEPEVLKARVKPMMLRLEPAFDEGSVGWGAGNEGFSTFSAFLKACRDVVEEIPGLSDHRIRLREAGTRGGKPTRPDGGDKGKEDLGKLLVAAVTFVGKERESVSLAILKNMIGKLAPGFDEKKLGARSFLDFVEGFPDLVRVDGEREWRTVELLVEPDEHGYVAPQRRTPLVEVLPHAPVVLASLAFHFDQLRPHPAADWPEYYARLSDHMNRLGHTLERPQLQAIKKVLMDLNLFHQLPNRGGIAWAPRMEEDGEILDLVEKRLGEILGNGDGGAAGDDLNPADGQAPG